jgi:hypothetical protein
MEYAGLIRRGWFVRALSGEQYALPEALAMLHSIRASNRQEERDESSAVLSATDPANPYGVLLPGCGVTREAGNLLVLGGGRVVLGLTAHALMMPERLDPDRLNAALTALMRARPKLRLDTIAGAPALESEHVGLFAAMRFHSDGRALVYDGLPGPMPARAATALAHS